MAHINKGTLLSHKKEWKNGICSNMNAARNYHTKWSKSNTERQIQFPLYVESKIWHNETIYEIETESQT